MHLAQALYFWYTHRERKNLLKPKTLNALNPEPLVGSASGAAAGQHRVPQFAAQCLREAPFMCSEGLESPNPKP